MPNEQIGYLHPFFFGHELHEVLFNLVGVVVLGESKSLGQTADMRINSNPFDHSVRILKDYVCGLPSYARKFKKLIHGSWNFVSVFFDEHFAAVLDILGFVMVESAGFYLLFEFFEVSVGEVFSCSVFLEECWGYLVDLFIRCLG